VGAGGGHEDDADYMSLHVDEVRATASQKSVTICNSKCKTDRT
jgi:hypothetical protein